MQLSARKGILRILGKGEKVREIPIHPDLRAALSDWIGERADWSGADTRALGSQPARRPPLGSRGAGKNAVTSRQPRADRASTQPVDAAAGPASDRWEPGRLPLVALSRWP